MFIRFVSGVIDEDSGFFAGLFNAAYDLLDEHTIPLYQAEALTEELNWFTNHLKVPFDYRLEPWSLANKSLCWFRDDAHEHLAHAWEITSLLRSHDVYVHTIKCDRPGYILYWDEAQILAYPFADTRRRMFWR